MHQFDSSTACAVQGNVAGGSISIGSYTAASPLVVNSGCRQITAHLAQSRKPLWKLLDDIDTVLHAREKRYFDTLIADARRHSFVLGRYVAKLALVCNDVTVRERSHLSDIEIDFGVFRQPVVNSNVGTGSQVSISHSHEWAGALAFPEAHPMAIDVERMDDMCRLVSLMPLSAEEKKLLDGSPLPQSEGYTLVWTIKEAISKVLKTGLTVDFRMFEISKFRMHGCHVESLFSNFPQYRAVSWRFHGMAWSIVLPKNSEFDVDLLLADQYKHFGMC